MARNKYCVLEDPLIKDYSHHPIWLLLITFILISLGVFTVYNDRISDLEQKTSIAPPDPLAGTEWKCTKTTVIHHSLDDSVFVYCYHKCMPRIDCYGTGPVSIDTCVLSEHNLQEDKDCFNTCMIEPEPVASFKYWNETICTEKTLVKMVEEVVK